MLPGVTVEASSAALIEKVRSVISDGGGQYRIVDLRPGVYTVTFTLTGFNTFIRDGLELTGDFTATINAELRVGSIEETITVTGEAPVVDVQGVTRQRVLTNEVIEAVPTGILCELGCAGSRNQCELWRALWVVCTASMWGGRQATREANWWCMGVASVTSG